MVWRLYAVFAIIRSLFVGMLDGSVWGRRRHEDEGWLDPNRGKNVIYGFERTGARPLTANRATYFFFVEIIFFSFVNRHANVLSARSRSNLLVARYFHPHFSMVICILSFSSILFFFNIQICSLFSFNLKRALNSQSLQYPYKEEKEK